MEPKELSVCYGGAEVFRGVPTRVVIFIEQGDEAFRLELGKTQPGMLEQMMAFGKAAGEKMQQQQRRNGDANGQGRPRSLQDSGSTP